jgi:hypothetical protein
MADAQPVGQAANHVFDICALLADPATSYWLKHALTSALERDPFDAERDALVLASLLTRNLDAIVDRHFSKRA